MYVQYRAPVQEKEEVKGDDDPPEDAFLMVTQQHWEDKILWDTPYTPGPTYTGAGNILYTSNGNDALPILVLPVIALKLKH